MSNIRMINVRSLLGEMDDFVHYAGQVYVRADGKEFLSHEAKSWWDETVNLIDVLPSGNLTEKSAREILSLCLSQDRHLWDDGFCYLADRYLARWMEGRE